MTTEAGSSDLEGNEEILSILEATHAHHTICFRQTFGIPDDVTIQDWINQPLAELDLEQLTPEEKEVAHQKRFIRYRLVAISITQYDMFEPDLLPNLENVTSKNIDNSKRENPPIKLPKNFVAVSNERDDFEYYTLQTTDPYGGTTYYKKCTWEEYQQAWAQYEETLNSSKNAIQ